jgi:hypothetical protein
VTEVALYFGRLLPLLLGPWIAQHLMTEVALFGRLMPSLVGLWFAWQRIVSEGALTGNVQLPLLGPWILQLVLTEVALFGRLLPTMVGLWFMQPLVTEGAWFVCFLSSFVLTALLSISFVVCRSSISLVLMLFSPSSCCTACSSVPRPPGGGLPPPGWVMVLGSWLRSGSWMVAMPAGCVGCWACPPARPLLGPASVACCSVAFWCSLTVVMGGLPRRIGSWSFSLIRRRGFRSSSCSCTESAAAGAG